jgi:hypothetical protein
MKSYCSRCKAKKDLHINARDKLKSGKVVIRWYCKRCTRERGRKYRAAGGKVKQLEANKRWEAKNPGWRAKYSRQRRLDKNGKT